MKEKKSCSESLTDRFSVLPYYLNSTRKPFRDDPPPILEHINLTEASTIQVPGPISFNFVPDMPHVAGPWNTPQLKHINLPTTMQGPGQMLSSVLPKMPQVSGPAINSQHRRLYVGNIPPNITKNMLLQFFNHQMYILNLGPILECQLFRAKRFAFLEFSSVDETTQAMALDGINMMGRYLKIRRPDKYRPSVIQSYTSNYVDAESPNTIYIGALPSFLSDDQVKELLLPFGKLKSFKHVRDLKTGISKGFAFCEYMDAGVTDQAIDALNWLQLCDRKLIVQRASLGSKKAQKAADPSLSPTEVLCLVNIVTLDELRQEKKCDDILKGFKEECAKFGVVRSVKMPRPIEGEDVPGCGNIFVLFDSALDCQKAKEELTKCNFNGRSVMTSYFDPEKYNKREFEILTKI